MVIRTLAKVTGVGPDHYIPAFYTIKCLKPCKASEVCSVCVDLLIILAPIDAHLIELTDAATSGSSLFRHRFRKALGVGL